MPMPLSHVVVFSDDLEFRTIAVTALNRASTASDFPSVDMPLAFFSAETLAETLERALADGSLQAVICDVRHPNGIQATVASIKAARAELDVFIAVGDGFAGLNSTLAGLGVEIFDRREENFPQIYRQIQSVVLRRAATPFADTLRDYVHGGRDAWHTPGHSGGDSLRDSPWVGDFIGMMGEHIFSTDLSVSVQVLDSLLEPHSVIQESQALAAKAFGADHTFFVTNGTSTANKVIVQHLMGGGGKVIVDQACHKSIHHAIILFGVVPVYLQASVNTQYSFYGPVPKSRIFSAIDANPDAGMLILTSCTYDGFYYDLAPIIARAHAAGIKVLIDEAWYAHGRFHPDLRPNALDSGADYVTQSTHKMLSAFSQASMIHVSDPDFDEHRFRENLNMHTSTSPQYAMIASLDVARKQMSMEGFSRLSLCIDIASRLRFAIDQTGVFSVLKLADMIPEELLGDNISLDPTKLTIACSRSGLTARKIQLALFEHYGIQVEKVTHNTVSILVTLGTTESKVLRLLRALQELAVNAPGASEATAAAPAALPELSELRQVPRDAYFGPSRVALLHDSEMQLNPEIVGAISADQIVPYPPGIPVLVPGQVITEAIARFLSYLCRGNSGLEMHGVIDSEEEPKLRVVAA
ncbi:MAG: ornithine decarboxylase [Halioglobus sp.]